MGAWDRMRRLVGRTAAPGVQSTVAPISGEPAFGQVAADAPATRRDDPPTAAFPVHAYWDAPEVPAEVLENVRTVQDAMPGSDLTLLDRAAAHRFIARHQGARSLAAFEACGPPAMQADYLRLCIMDAVGGLYVDADDVALQPLGPLLAGAPVALLATWLVVVGNGILFFRQPRHPFMRCCLELATDNIEARRYNDVLLTAGPGVLTAVGCAGDEEREALTSAVIELSPWNSRDWADLLSRARIMKDRIGFSDADRQALTFMTVEECGAWVTTRPMGYKSTPRHWVNWPGSIYQDVEFAPP